MLRKFILPALAASLVLSACDQSPTGPSPTNADDYALVMFGESGSALEGSMGTQAAARPFDGRTGFPPFPDSIALSPTQRDAIAALRLAFRTAHQAQLDSLKVIFEAARTAHQGGATRDEVRAILAGARPIAMALRPDLEALHQAVRALLTDAQRAWIEAHRPRLPLPIARP